MHLYGCSSENPGALTGDAQGCPGPSAHVFSDYWAPSIGVLTSFSVDSRGVGGTPLSVLISVHPHSSFSQALPVPKRWTVLLETRHY